MDNNEINNEITHTEDTVNETAELTGQPSGQPSGPKTGWKKEAFEWAEAIVVAVVIALIIKAFLFTLVTVEGESMQNTLHTGDRLFVWRLGYTPQNGDIVVFRPERDKTKPYIKRVIATAGQTIDIDFAKGIVIVDGKVIDEDYIKMPTTAPGDVKFPVTVPEGYFFAMGDNRGHSKDSRYSVVGSADNSSGLIKNKSLLGHALFRLWPFSQFGGLE